MWNDSAMAAAFELMSPHYRISEEEHAKALLFILEDSEPLCETCPHPLTLAFRSCPTCKTFIGLPNLTGCPCRVLGKTEAAKLSWLALEEKGYI